MLTFFLCLATLEYILPVAEAVVAGKTWAKKSMVWRLFSFSFLVKAAQKPEQNIIPVRIRLPRNPGVTSLFQYHNRSGRQHLKSCRSDTSLHACPLLRTSLLTPVASSKYLTMPFVRCSEYFHSSCSLCCAFGSLLASDQVSGPPGTYGAHGFWLIL